VPRSAQNRAELSSGLNFVEHPVARLHGVLLWTASLARMLMGAPSGSPERISAADHSRGSVSVLRHPAWRRECERILGKGPLSHYMAWRVDRSVGDGQLVVVAIDVS